MVICLLGFLFAGGALDSARAQGVPWNYVPNPDSVVPPPSIGLVPGRGPIGELSQGWTVDTGVSLSYDDNQFQTSRDEFAGGILVGDVSLHYARGEQKQRGVFFGGNLDIAYYDYLDEPVIGEQRSPGDPTLPGEPLAPLNGRSPRDGQEPFEIGFDAYVGVKGAKTTVTLSGSFSEDNGNSTDQQRQDRENLRSSSKTYTVGLNGRRQVGRGVVDAGITLQEKEYTGRLEEALETGVTPIGARSDETRWNSNLGWTIKPVATPKTDFRLGVQFGQSEQDGGVDEDTINPSVGATYRYTPKTSLFGNVGVNFRRSESTITRVVPVAAPPAPAPAPPPMIVTETNSFDSALPTFSFGGAWSPDSTTRFSANISQYSSASSIRGQSSYETRSLTLTGTKQLRRGYYASCDYSLEDTSYTDSRGEEDSTVGRPGTPDTYSRLGLTFGRQVQLRPKILLNMSVFYQRNIGSGDDILSEFEQNVAGIRVGLSF